MTVDIKSFSQAPAAGMEGYKSIEAFIDAAKAGGLLKLKPEELQAIDPAYLAYLKVARDKQLRPEQYLEENDLTEQQKRALKGGSGYLSAREQEDIIREKQEARKPKKITLEQQAEYTKQTEKNLGEYRTARDKGDREFKANRKEAQEDLQKFREEYEFASREIPKEIRRLSSANTYGFDDMLDRLPHEEHSVADYYRRQQIRGMVSDDIAAYQKQEARNNMTPSQLRYVKFHEQKLVEEAPAREKAALKAAAATLEMYRLAKEGRDSREESATTAYAQVPPGRQDTKAEAKNKDAREASSVGEQQAPTPQGVAAPPAPKSSAKPAATAKSNTKATKADEKKNDDTDTDDGSEKKDKKKDWFTAGLIAAGAGLLLLWNPAVFLILAAIAIMVGIVHMSNKQGWSMLGGANSQASNQNMQQQNVAMGLGQEPARDPAALKAAMQNSGNKPFQSSAALNPAVQRTQDTGLQRS